MYGTAVSLWCMVAGIQNWPCVLSPLVVRVALRHSPYGLAFCGMVCIIISPTLSAELERNIQIKEPWKVFIICQGRCRWPCFLNFNGCVLCSLSRRKSPKTNRQPQNKPQICFGHDSVQWGKALPTYQQSAIPCHRAEGMCDTEPKPSTILYHISST